MIRVIAILVVAIPFLGQGPPESLELIERAIEKSELRTAEVAPFRLTAEIQAKGADSKLQKGMYELLWVSPERWREDITVSGVKETRIGGAGKVWQFPTSAPAAAGIRIQARKLAFREKLGVGAGDSIGAPKERKVEGTRLLCLKRKLNFEIEYCFDPASGLLDRTKSGATWLEYKDYKPAGTKVFPRSLVEGEVQVARVLAIETNVLPDAALFEPPAGIVPEPGCQYPKFPKVVEMEGPGDQGGVFGPRAMVAVAGLVKVDGSIEDVRIIHSSGPDADSSALRAVRHWKFQPAMCGVTPVPYKIAIELSF